jgi:hypothetical protein
VCRAARCEVAGDYGFTWFVVAGARCRGVEVGEGVARRGRAREARRPVARARRSEYTLIFPVPDMRQPSDTTHTPHAAPRLSGSPRPRLPQTGALHTAHAVQQGGEAETHSPQGRQLTWSRATLT